MIVPPLRTLCVSGVPATLTAQIELLNQLVAAQDSQIRQLQQRVVDEHHQRSRVRATSPPPR